jgi:hypothetical protein
VVFSELKTGANLSYQPSQVLLIQTDHSKKALGASNFKRGKRKQKKNKGGDLAENTLLKENWDDLTERVTLKKKELFSKGQPAAVTQNASGRLLR